MNEDHWTVVEFKDPLATVFTGPFMTYLSAKGWACDNLRVDDGWEITFQDMSPYRKDT